MRILLVKCTAHNREVPQTSPPLGLMCLASYLRQTMAGHHQMILDLNCTPNPASALAQALASYAPDVVAISALTSEAQSLHEVSRAVRAHRQDVIVVAGGSHVSACPKDVTADPHIDVMVFGEGELTYAEIVRALSEGTIPRDIAGAAWREDGSMRQGPDRAPIPDLDALPFPAWDLVDIDLYARRGRAGNLPRGRYMGLFTSRGCPFQCSYCHRTFPKLFRSRSPANVLAEVAELETTYGIRDFEIYDDAFNLDIERAKSICRGLTNRDLRFSFPHGVRADRLDRELVALLAAIGTTNLGIAVDTASPDRQRKLGRNLDIDRVRTSIDWANEEGITTIGYFMLGFPGETRAEMEATIRFAVESRLLFASFFIVTPYPGTPLWDETVGRREDIAVDYRSLNVFAGYFNLSAVSGRELRSLQRAAYMRFYRRRLLRIATALPRLRVDWRNAAWIGLRRLADRGTHLRPA